MTVQRPVNTDITANADQAVREFGRFGDAAAAAYGKATAGVSGLRDVSAAATKALTLMASAVAASSVSAAVKHQIDLMDATGKAAAAAGVSAESFSTLAYAAELADVDAEALGKAMAKLSGQMLAASNGDAKLRNLFQQVLKVDVRDAAGALRETDEVLMDVADRFADLADGPAKVGLAIEVFGEKAGPRLVPFLNQGRAGIEQLRNELRVMGGEITGAQASAAETFNDSMAKIGRAASMASRSISVQFLPTLANAADKLAAAAVQGRLWAEVLERIKRNAAFDELSRRRKDLEHLNQEVARAQFYWENMRTAADRNPPNPHARQQEQYAARQLADAQRRTNEAQQALLRMASSEADADSPNPVGGGRGIVNPPLAGAGTGRPQANLGALGGASGAGGDNRMSGWEAELAAQKAAHERAQVEAGTFYAFGQSREVAYWQGILATLDQGDKARSAVERRYYAQVLDLRKEDFAALQAGLKTQIDAAKNNFEEQGRLAAVYLENARQRYGKDSAEYQAALRQQQEIAREDQRVKLAIAAVRSKAARDELEGELDAVERNARQMLMLGAINQEQLLQVRAQVIERRGQIEMAAAQAELAAMRGNPNADKEALEKKEAELAAIRRKYRGLQDDNKNAQALEVPKPLANILASSEQALQQGLQSMVTKMKLTWDGIHQMNQQIGASLVQELVTKPAAAWVANQVRMVALSALYGSQRVAAEAATTGTIGAMQLGLGLRSISISSAEAAANAYKSIAAIPVVGPVLAPAAAATALVAVLALGRKVFSAEGGFDIPRGVNPMTQLHQEEMVLPASPANALRAISEHIASGGGLGGGGGPVNITIKAMDSRDVRQFMLDNSHHVAASVRRAVRDFNLNAGQLRGVM